MKGFWANWQISGWYGKWSKYHFFRDKGTLTACGITPQPDNCQIPKPSWYKDEVADRLKCKRCLRSVK